MTLPPGAMGMTPPSASAAPGGTSDAGTQRPSASFTIARAPAGMTPPPASLAPGGTEAASRPSVGERDHLARARRHDLAARERRARRDVLGQLTVPSA